MNMNLFLIILLGSMASAVIVQGEETKSPPRRPYVSPVIEDGKAIIEPGIFTDGCYYGINESISDHAPVIYGILGTWNITGPISHIAVGPAGKPALSHVNHTFMTNENHITIDRYGKAGDLAGDSEKVALKKVFTKERIKQMIEKNENNQVVRDTSAIKKQFEEAQNKALAVLRNDGADESELAAWATEINKIKILAIQEVDNPGEESFANTQEMLKILESTNYSINNKYMTRIEAIAGKVRELFKRYPDLQHIVLQEMPKYSDKTLAGEDVGALIKEVFEPSDPWVDAIINVLDTGSLENADIRLDTGRLEKIFADAPERIPNGDSQQLLKNLADLRRRELVALSTPPDNNDKQKIVRALSRAELKNLLGIKDELRLTFVEETAQTAISNTDYRKNNTLDVAIVSRATAPLLTQVNPPDVDNRLVPWCSEKTKQCFVSAHLPMAKTNVELGLRCQDIRAMAQSLHRKGFDEIRIAGDYNVDADRVAKVCNNKDHLTLPRPVGVMTIHSSVGKKGSSCKANKKEDILVPKNIDIMIKYQFEPKG